MALPVSPLAPDHWPTLTPLAGVKLAAGHAGIRYKDRHDVMLALLPEGTQAAGVFTRSRTAAAPIDWCKTALAATPQTRAVLVNAGNANAFTGAHGMHATRTNAESVARALGVKPEQVMIASTGVIGEKLPFEKIDVAIPALLQAAGESGWEEAAVSILTTDTFKKTARATFSVGGKACVLQGFAKGSGMIAPDMATMLAFLFTDAAIDAPLLQAALSAANERSFNAITVDSDTSTNDCALLFATGTAGNVTLSAETDADFAAFENALHWVMLELATLVVRDGEGATKFVEIHVEGAETEEDAKRIALSIGNSPLVKTALAASDANWGRIVAAVGKSGAKADRDKLQLWIGAEGAEVLVAAEGGVHADYREADIQDHMRGQRIRLRLDAGVGEASFTAYTCDFTEGYIRINGSYRS